MRMLDHEFSLPRVGFLFHVTYVYSMKCACLLPNCHISARHTMWQLSPTAADDASQSTPVQINVNNLTAVVWVLSLGFPIFQGANLLLVQYYSMLSAAAVYDNEL